MYLFIYLSHSPLECNFCMSREFDFVLILENMSFNSLNNPNGQVLSPSMFYRKGNKSERGSVICPYSPCHEPASEPDGGDPILFQFFVFVFCVLVFFFLVFAAVSPGA